MHKLEDSYELYWGDLHNHNGVGYAKGSLARSIEIATEHLDFFAFTGHASWHDMPVMPKDQHMHWVHGFKRHTEHWPETRRMIAQANGPEFTALLGYEWHSSEFGDYCVIFPGDHEELFLPDNVGDLHDFAERAGALAIPHHVAYKQGWRGGNWDHFRPSVTPVVEIFSEQGCTFSDNSPYPMVLHSNGGRVTEQTLLYQLRSGKRFGFVAATDDHFGYPGGYGEGLTGVWAKSLAPADLFEALRARRTVSVTGDRIAVDFSVNGHTVGSDAPASAHRTVEVDVRAPDTIEAVEIMRGAETVHRHFVCDHAASEHSLPGTVQCRIQYGWGPWAALDLERVCEWEMTLAVTGGHIVDFERCFQSGPFGEEIIDRAVQRSASEVDLHSFTSRKQAYLQDPTKAVVLNIEADANAKLEVRMRRPAEITRTIPLADLAERNEVAFTGVFTSESVQVHRLVFPDQSRAHVEWEEDRPDGAGDFYYARVKLHNGHYAWTSPVWVG